MERKSIFLYHNGFCEFINVALKFYYVIVAVSKFLV